MANPKVLTKQIGPGTPLGLSSIGVEILPREDQVLLMLAKSDEREYSKMLITDTAISGAIQQRFTGLLSEGSEIVPGNESSSALRMQQFAITVLKNIPNLTQILEEILEARWFGWRPIEIQYTTDLRFEGRSYWGIEKMVARDPWNYAITPDGALTDQRLAARTGTDVVYDTDDERMRWLICTSGSTASPYGMAIAKRMWLLFFLSKKFENMSAKAMQRALGILKASKQGSSPLSSTGAKDNKALADLKRILDRLNTNNVLWESGGWVLEMLTDVEMPQNMIDILDWFDEKKRIAILGQNLTSKVSQGSFAAAKEHSKVAEAIWKSDAKFLASVINDHLLPRVMTLNMGDVDPEDMPRWRSLAFSKPDLDATKAFYDMGGVIDGKRFGESYRIPIAADPDQEGALVRKPGDPAVTGRQTLQGQPDTTAQNNGNARSAPDPAVDGKVRRLMGDYYRRLGDQFLEDNPDPKANGRLA